MPPSRKKRAQSSPPKVFFKTLLAKLSVVTRHMTWPGFLMAGLFLVGAFYRFRYASTFMTEYDDLGTIALNISGHQYLINPYQYFHNIAAGWTYPPGQFFIFSLLFIPFADVSIEGGKLIAGDMDFQAMHTVARLFVGACSVANIVLMWWILRSYFDRGRASVSTLLCMALLCLSFFHIAYSYHTGPYVPALTAMLLMIVMAWNSTYKTPKWIAFFVITAVLTHFNYLIFIMLPGLIISVIYEVWRREGTMVFIKQHLFRKIVGSLLFLLLVAHLFVVSFLFKSTVYLKSNRGMHSEHLFKDGIGEAFVNFWKDLYGIFHNIFDVSYNLVPQLEYIFYVPIFVLILIGVGVGIWRIISARGEKGKDQKNLVTLFLLLFALTWLILHGFRKLPFQETRHLIFWTPFYLVFLKLGVDAVIDRWFKTSQTAYLEWILIPVVLFGLTSNLYFTERQAYFSFDEIKALVEQYNPATMGMDLATLHTLMLNKHFPDIYINPQVGEDFADPNGMPNWPGFSERPYMYIGQSEPLSPVFIQKLKDAYGKELVYESVEAPEKDVYISPNNTPLNSCRNAKYIYVFE